MKWLLVIGVLAVLTLSGCCQSGGLFNRQPAYGSYYQPAPYGTPAATYASDPCACQQ